MLMPWKVNPSLMIEDMRRSSRVYQFLATWPTKIWEISLSQSHARGSGALTTFDGGKTELTCNGIGIGTGMMRTTSSDGVILRLS